MKKLIIIISIIIIGGLAFAGCGSPKDSLNPENSTKNSSQEDTEKLETNGDKEESFFGSMQDLMARGKSLKCAYKASSSNSDDEYETVMYISGGNVKTETKIKTDEGKTEESNMIISKDWMYMWNSFTLKGTKTDMSKMPKMENVTDKDVNKDMANLAKKMDYKCRAWIPDNSKFKVPTNIQFEDITEIMAGMADVVGNMTEKDIKEMENEANEWICEHCKSAPTPELMKECLGDVICE